jgi:hypothetical protein
MNPAIMFAIATLAQLALLAPAAVACSTCQVGQEVAAAPAVSSTSASPAASSVSLELSGQARELGARDARLRILDHRATVGGAWMPSSTWRLAASLPVVRRETQARNGELQRAVGPGDVLLSADAMVLRRPRARLWTSVAMQLPTAPRVATGGQTLDDDAQLGSGAFIALPGLRYASARGVLRPTARMSAVLPTRSRFGLVPGVGLLASTGIDVHVTGRWVVVADIDLRSERPDRVDGAPDPNSGGTIAFVSPALRAQVGQRVVLRAGARVPIANALRGQQREGWIAHTGVGITLGRRNAPASSEVLIALAPER